MAHKAVSPSFLLGVAHIESPQRRYSARVRDHGLEKAPEHHEKQEVKVGEVDKHMGFFLELTVGSWVVCSHHAVVYQHNHAQHCDHEKITQQLPPGQWNCVCHIANILY